MSKFTLGICALFFVTMGVLLGNRWFESHFESPSLSGVKVVSAPTPVPTNSLPATASAAQPIASLKPTSIADVLNFRKSNREMADRFLKEGGLKGGEKFGEFPVLLVKFVDYDSNGALHGSDFFIPGDIPTAQIRAGLAEICGSNWSAVYEEAPNISGTNFGNELACYYSIVYKEDFEHGKSSHCSEARNVPEEPIVEICNKKPLTFPVYEIILTSMKRT